MVRTASSRFPRNVWDWRDYFSADRAQTGGATSASGAASSRGVDEFDPLFFNISRKRPRASIPRNVCSCSMHGSRSKMRVTRASLPNDRVGVYAGAMHSEYQLFGAEASVQGQRMAVSSSFASIANRVSYLINAWLT